MAPRHAERTKQRPLSVASTTQSLIPNFSSGSPPATKAATKAAATKAALSSHGRDVELLDEKPAQGKACTPVDRVPKLCEQDRGAVDIQNKRESRPRFLQVPEPSGELLCRFEILDLELVLILFV